MAYLHLEDRQQGVAAALIVSPDDRRLAEAFRSQEHMVALLAGASALMNVAIGVTIGTHDRALFEAAGLRKDQMPGWHLYALTPERAEALHHALNHVQDVIGEFQRQYLADLELDEVTS
ncbi:hypothetical protein [Bosea sp. PAMC 26642]|uniref:hypothetical protein n=1 Tax=Bosea sp. (strain PAMC 26642) TaxID=1792307 RepID=UPI0007701DD0|nr:hypothetical protein [Bosea sp. PAMC 26642]AMJ60930.1 hypothetical protein AXW83_12065 [Bosea sp. PAMC 26642]